MQIQTLLYIYLFVCTMMIIFNIAVAVILKRRDKKTERVSRDLEKRIVEQIEQINDGGEVDEKHKNFFRRRMSHVGNMIALDIILDKLLLDPDMADGTLKYLSELDGVIAGLAIRYSEKESITAAYFPYIVKKYRLIKGKSYGVTVDTMLCLLREKSIYCRENALLALCVTGSSDVMLKALYTIDTSDCFYNSKILTDGLLHFEGNHAELCELIKAEFANFTPQMQVSLMNFLRFDSEGHSAFAYDLLKNKQTDKEVKYSCLRYLGKYAYEPARELICELARTDDDEKWECPAIASSALAAYPGEETYEILRHNLYSKSWYIRFNSSQSLERLGYTYLDLIDVMEGEDRYATEILRYRFDIKEMIEKEKRKETTNV